MSQIHNSHTAFTLLKDRFNEFCEEFWLINLNTKLEVKNLKLISRGTLNFCLVHPRDLFREALLANSYAIIIAHNHPSGDVQPTDEDIILTKKLVKISKTIEIPLLDHIVFSDRLYFSFKEKNLL
ncbi:MAG: JAB domain-containing protein [Pseudobdellovibrio sp.]